MILSRTTGQNKNSSLYYIAGLATFLPLITLGQAPCPAGKLCPPVTAIGSTLKDFIDLLISIIQAVGIPVLVVCIIYAGYLMLSADGNEAEITKAKTWIFWTLVGAAIILGAQVIADMIFNTASLF